MFATVPARYDLLNRLLTLRLDEAWRSRAAGEILRHKPGKVLDVGCGTADLAVRLSLESFQGPAVTGVDFSWPMLEMARVKTVRAGVTGRLRLVCADASSLAFSDARFDTVGLAFSFRNLVWRNPLKDLFLTEIYRVLKPGGRIVIVESSQPSSPFLRFIFHTYLVYVVTRLGGLISGSRGAYKYLAESARFFHNPEELSAMLTDAGFRKVRYQRLLGGVAALHVGEK